MTTIRRSVLAPVLACVLMLVLVGCGSSGTESSDTEPGASTTATSAGEPADTTESNGSSDDRVPGVPWGPDDPPIPGQYGALAASSDDGLDCELVEQAAPDEDFWSTVLAVCLALRGDGEWPTNGVTEPPEAENEFQDCLNRELATMLRALLDRRAADPGAQPEIAYPPASARSPCELRIYGAAVFEVGASDDHPTGGVVVELQVPGLVNGDPDPLVRVDGQPIELEDDFGGAGDGLSFGQIHLPAPIEARTATIEVETYFGVLRTTVELPEVEASGSGASQTTTP